MRRAVAAFAVIAAALGAWWWGFGPGHTAQGARSGTIAFDWRGTFNGRAVLPARVSWCPVTRIGVLDAIAADTGVEIVFYEKDSLSAGTHPIVAASNGGAMPRPGATVAFRWSPGNDSLEGFRSGTGTAALRWTDGTLSGVANAHLQAAIGFDTLRFSATFDHLPVTATAAGCN